LPKGPGAAAGDGANGPDAAGAQADATANTTRRTLFIARRDACFDGFDVAVDVTAAHTILLGRAGKPATSVRKSPGAATSAGTSIPIYSWPSGKAFLGPAGRPPLTIRRMPPVVVRPATALDAEGILVCLRAAFEPYRTAFHRGSVHRYGADT